MAELFHLVLAEQSDAGLRVGQSQRFPVCRNLAARRGHVLESGVPWCPTASCGPTRNCPQRRTIGSQVLLLLVSVLRTPNQVNDSRTAMAVSRSHWDGERTRGCWPIQRVRGMPFSEVDGGWFSCRGRVTRARAWAASHPRRGCTMPGLFAHKHRPLAQCEGVRPIRRR